MRKHGRAMIEGAGLLLVGLLLFLFPEESVAAAREGISLCVDVLIPSLFPFFVLSSLFDLHRPGWALCSSAGIPHAAFVWCRGCRSAALSLGLMVAIRGSQNRCTAGTAAGVFPDGGPAALPFLQ